MCFGRREEARERGRESMRVVEERNKNVQGLFFFFCEICYISGSRELILADSLASVCESVC